MKQFTPWFDGNIKPVHIGIYQRDNADIYYYWDGEYWSILEYRINSAFINKRIKSIYQNLRWRGYTTEQK